MKTLRNYILIILAALSLGFIATKQFYLQKEVNKVVNQSELGSAMAVEVTELIKNNQKLQKDTGILKDQLEKLSKSAADTQSANEALRESLDNYKIALGIVDIKGKGVTITFNEKIDSTQLIDLVNSIKNIGAEAISINNKRFAVNSSVENGTFNPPVIVDVIGDQNILKESLIRLGGIIEQIGIGQVEKNDNIFIKAN